MNDENRRKFLKGVVAVPAGLLASSAFGSFFENDESNPGQRKDLLLDRVIHGSFSSNANFCGPTRGDKGRLRLTGFQDQPADINWGKESYFVQVGANDLLIAGDRERVDGWDPASLISSLRVDDCKAVQRPYSTLDAQVAVTRFDPLSRLVDSPSDPNYLKFQFAGPQNIDGPRHWWDNHDTDRLLVGRSREVALQSGRDKILTSPSIHYDAEWMLRTAYVELGDHGILGIRPVQHVVPEEPLSARSYMLFAYKVEPDDLGMHGLGPAKLGLIAKLDIDGNQGFLSADMESLSLLEDKITARGLNPEDFITPDYAKISFGGLRDDTSLNRLYGVTNQGQNDSVLNLSRNKSDPTSLLPIAFGHNSDTYGRAQWLDR